MVIEGWLEPECVVVASAGSGRSPAVSGSVIASMKLPLPFATKPLPSPPEAPNPPKPALPITEPQPTAVAAPHAHAHAGPARVALVAPVAPVESPAPLVIVDAPPGAPILAAPLASVALPAPIAAVGSSPHAVSATTGGPSPGEVGGAVALSAPVLPTAATLVLPPDVQVVPDPAPLAAALLAQPVPPPAPSASAAAHGNRICLLRVPPVAGMEFVTVAGGPVTAQYPSLLPVALAPPAATVYGHPALSQGVPLDSGPWDECLDAADRLAELLAPVLATPARGGVAGVGQLGTADRGLRRFLRERTAVDLIGATTVVVRELHRSLMVL
ncbi:unnamed protein product [Closterium sp. Naga37s-1]|nr:unnamed protein product [Closterium sp. Naga37s-1]